MTDFQKAKKETMYLWQVTLGDRSVYTPAVDKLQASKRGAALLGVRWRETAAQMDVMRLRKASERDIAAYERRRD